MTTPLEGVKVLDLTIWQQGPVASAMLADMGADVIKIEQPVQGDPGRGLVWASDKSPLNTYFECHNRNKRGLAVDLTKEKGQQILHRLVKNADVFIHNLRPSAIKKMKADYPNLSQINPRLIYASGNGYGSQGPDVAKASFDIVAQGRGGLLSIAGEPDQPPPLIQVIGAADWVAAAMLSYGIMVALFTREKTGIGQEVEVSLLGSQAALNQLALQRYLFSGRSPVKVSRKSVSNPLWNSYQAGDGKWLILAALQADRYWADFCKILGLENARDDPRFNVIPNRRKNSTALIAILDQAFLKKTRNQWIKEFEKADIPCGQVNDFEDLSKDPQMKANDYIADFNHPTAGPIKLVGIPVKLSKTPGSIRKGAPELGADTEEILLENGFSWDDIGKFREEQVI